MELVLARRHSFVAVLFSLLFVVDLTPARRMRSAGSSSSPSRGAVRTSTPALLAVEGSQTILECFVASINPGGSSRPSAGERRSAIDTVNWNHRGVDSTHSDVVYGRGKLMDASQHSLLAGDNTSTADGRGLPVHLVIKSVKLSHSGRYTCQNGQAVATVQLIVLSAGQTSCTARRRHDDSREDTLNVSENQEIVVKCLTNYSGNLRPYFANWTSHHSAVSFDTVKTKEDAVTDGVERALRSSPQSFIESTEVRTVARRPLVLSFTTSVCLNRRLLR